MDGVFLGFDFGTYTTKVSYYRSKDKIPKVLQIPPFCDSSSGIIYSFISKDFSKIGKEAYRDYKSGSNEIDYGFKMKLETDEGYERSKRFLKAIYEGALKRLKEIGLELKGVRFSVPNSWASDENARFLKLLQEIGVIKDYNQDIIEREPYAAAVYHIFKDIDRAGKRALVIDAGAGTIDITVGDITPEGNFKEIEKSYKTLEKAGRFVDERIKEFYKLENLWQAENLKFLLSYEFGRGKEEVMYNKFCYKKAEFEEECLKDWIQDYKNFLSEFKGYNPDYVLFAGGFSAFYLIKKVAKDLFPKANEYPINEKEHPLICKELRIDMSISKGCSILASGIISIRETIKYDVYWKLYSWTAIEDITYRDEKVEFKKGKNKGEYLIQLFQNTDYVDKMVDLSKFKINGEPFEVKSYGSIRIVIKDRNKEVEKELPIKHIEFKGKVLSNLKFKVDRNKVFKVIYEYEDGNSEILTSLDLNSVQEI